MKKRFMSIVMTLALVLSLMPALGLTAAALEPEQVTTWAELKAALSNGGSFVLANDITAEAGAEELEVPEGVTAVLDLNGHVLNRNLPDESATTKTVFLIKGSLTINDSNPEEIHHGKISHEVIEEYNCDIHCWTLDGSGNVDVKGGIITGWKIEAPYDGDDAGCFYVDGGSIEMNGGTVTGNIGFGASAKIFYLKEDASFTMNGGQIYENAIFGDGFVVLEQGTSFVLNDGKITSNTGGSGTSPVRIIGGSFTMNGGEISRHGYQDYDGYSTSIPLVAAVNINEGSFVMNGGSIKENKALGDYGAGCAVFVEQGETPASFIMNGGIITDNLLNGGDDIYCCSAAVGVKNGTFTVGGDAVISGNTNMRKNCPGNLYLGLNWDKVEQNVILSTEKPPKAGMNVGITIYAGEPEYHMPGHSEYFVLENATANHAKYFVPDDDEYVVKYEDGKLKLVTPPVIDIVAISEAGVLTINGKNYGTDGTTPAGGPALDTLGLAYSYDATNGAKLTVNGVDGVGPVIQSNTTKNAISGEVDLEIELNVDTIVKCKDDDEGHKAIDVSGDLKITGKHDLTASSATSDVISAGNISVDVDNLTAVAEGEDGFGIIAEGTLSILGDTTLEVSGVDCGLTVGGDLVLNHTGTVTVCGGFAVIVYNSVTTTKTGGLLAYGTYTAFETFNVDGMPEMLGNDVMWTAQNQVEPATPIHWVGHGTPEDSHKIACVMVDSNPAPAKTVKLGAVAPAPSGGSDPTYSITAPADTEHGAATLNKKSASSGETVTITVTPDKGYTLETLTVLDKNGKEVEVKNLGNNKYTFKMPSGKVTVSATFMEDNSMLNFFVDVPASEYYYDAVLWAAENGITDGVDAVHFAPNGGTTRAHVVTFLWRAAGCPEPKSMNSFADVAADTYYAKAVAWAIEQGITKGTSATTFSPNSICTRAQIAAFMARFAGVVDADCQTSFTDVSVNAYYASAVAWMLDNGVTEGTTATTYSPDADCSRAQIVTFLYRWMVK